MGNITLDKINKLKGYGLHLIPIEKKRPKTKRIGTNGSTDYSWKFADPEHTKFLEFSDEELLKYDLGVNHEASRTVAVDFDCEEALLFKDMIPETLTVSSVYDGHEKVRQKIYKLAADVEEVHESFPKANSKHQQKDGTVIEQLAHTQSWIEGSNRYISTDIPPKTLDTEEYESLRATTRKVYALSMFKRLYPKKDSNRDDFRLTLAGVLNLETKWDLKEKKEFVKKLCKAAGDKAVNKALEKIGRVEKNIKRNITKGREASYKIWGTKHMSEILGRLGQDGGMDFVDAIRDPSFEAPEPNEEEEKTVKPQGLTTLTLNEFVDRNYPPIQYYMYPIISDDCLGMIFALPGKGKTLFAQELAWRCSQGLDFMDYKYNTLLTPPPALYVEGEMSAKQIQDRLVKMVERDRGLKELDLDNFHIAVLKEQPNENYQKLQTPEGRLNVQLKADEIYKNTGRKPIIFLDNVRFLMGNFNEKEGQDWIDFVLWLATLRAKGYSTYFLHHAVNTGEKASGSGYQDSNLDVNIKLSEPEENSATDHDKDHFTQIQFEFKKMRENVMGHMKPFIMVVDRDKGTWTKFPVLNKTERKIKSMLDSGKAAKDIIDPDKEGMSKANVHKTINKLKGVITDGLNKETIDGKTKEIC